MANVQNIKGLKNSSLENPYDLALQSQASLGSPIKSSTPK